MAVDSITVGMTGTGSVTVAERHYASGVFAGAPDVFSTPSLAALIEATAAGCMEPHLDDGQMSVGTQLVINHTGATPGGVEVTVTVTVDAVGRRNVDFSWTAKDAFDDIGHGTHQRCAVDKGRFEAGLASKQGQGV